MKIKRFKAALVEDENGDFVKFSDFIEVKEVALALIQYIDAIPEDIDFKVAMPGFDRDWVENVLNVKL